MIQMHLVRLKTVAAVVVLFQLSSFAQVPASAATCSSVTLNGSSVWHPVSLRTENEATLRGIFPDIAREIFGELEIPTENGPDVPWKRVFVLLENGDTDVLTGAYRTRERFEKFGASLPVMTEEVAVFVRPNLASEPQSLEDLIGLTGLAPFGANFGEELDEFAARHLTIERQPFEVFATNMRLLNEEKVDYLIIARQEGERLAKYLGVEDSVRAMPWPAATNTLHFFFSRSSPCIDFLDAFNNVLKTQISSGALDKIVGGYQSAEHETLQD